MQSYDFYFSVMIFGAFAVFGVGLAVNYIQYRRWLNHSGSRR